MDKDNQNNAWYKKFLKPQVAFPTLLTGAVLAGFDYNSIISSQAADHTAITQLSVQQKADEDKYQGEIAHIDHVMTILETRLGVNEDGQKTGSR